MNQNENIFRNTGNMVCHLHCVDVGMIELSKCCNKYPTQYVPMTWGAVQIDPTLTPSVECDVCGRVTHGATEQIAADNWNAIDVPPIKKPR